jgi:type I restriction enzyme S subunit
MKTHPGNLGSPVKAPWPTVRLGEVLTPTERGETVDAVKEYRLLGVRLDGQGPFLRETVLGTQTSATKLFRVATDDFIYSRLFACRGAFGVIEKELDGCYVSGEFPTFVPEPGRVDVEFLKYWFRLRSVAAAVDADCSGSTPLTRNRFKEQFFLALEIPLPSLAEQRRVVARIEALAAQIQEARTLRLQAAQKAEELYAQQLGVAMTPHGEGWKRETVADVIESMGAGWSPQCDDIPARKGEWGVLKTTAVQWCDFQPQHNKGLPPTLAPIPELAVKEGDVLVTRAGPRKRVAVIAAVRRNEPRLTISDKLIRLRTDRTKIEPRFLELSLASPFSQEHLIQRKTGLADAQVNISQSILSATPVAYPPLPEQRRIVAELDALQAEVDALKRLQAETAAELGALLPSILDKAFKGEY